MVDEDGNDVAVTSSNETSGVRLASLGLEDHIVVFYPPGWEKYLLYQES